MHRHTHTHTHTHTHAWVFKMHLCTHGKQGHMHSGRYCYARIEIKLANAISFLPRAAGPICKHQTASLQKTCWISLFKARPHPPNPNSIITPVFIQNAFSLTVANYILIHEAHFIEEIVWLAWDWHWVAAVQKGRETKVRADESCCLLFHFFPPFSLSCWWKLAEIQESQWWLRAVEILCRLDSIQPFLFLISHLWQAERLRYLPATWTIHRTDT